MPRKKKILICPLNWGLGHATRCIPIINSFLKHDDVEIVIATSGRPLKLLIEEFPNLKHIDFPDYDIRYNKRGLMVLMMLRMIPRIIFGILREHRKLKNIIKEYDIDIVISDNRFGLWNDKIKSVFITHQIMIKTPKSLRFLEGLIYRVNMFFIKKYDECWIPDFEGKGNLSGDLSHLFRLPPKTYFIEPISRFINLPELEINNDILVVISGPEPERTNFENLVLEELKQTSLRAVVVLGKTEESFEYEYNKRIKVYSHVTQQKLNELMVQSDIIICRAGYTSIMDIANVGKKAIFVPTPGQTEQEYLARYYIKNKTYYSMTQCHFDIKKGLSRTIQYTPLKVNPESKLLEERIAIFLD